MGKTRDMRRECTERNRNLNPELRMRYQQVLTDDVFGGERPSKEKLISLANSIQAVDSKITDLVRHYNRTIDDILAWFMNNVPLDRLSQMRFIRAESSQIQ